MKLRSRVGIILLGLVLAMTGIATFAPPAVAAGGTASVSGNTITFTGTAEADSVTVTGSSADAPCATGAYCVFFSTSAGTLTAGTGCTSESTTLLACATSQPAAVTIALGAGNDLYLANRFSPTHSAFQHITVDGGDGNDIFLGGGAPETLIGGNGNDTFEPDQGPDALLVGPDTLIPGTGTDILSYFPTAGAASGVRISLNGVADDGTSLPRDVDNVGSGFEIISATTVDDVLVGDDQPTIFQGFEGNDTINGGGGDDVLLGHQGNDTLDGGGGDDVLQGHQGNDHLTGGPGIDEIWGDSDSNPDVTGDDTIVSADGESDPVNCGPGTDTVTADSIDKILDACESVTTGGGTVLSAEIQVTKPRLNANKRRKKATLPLQCTGGLPCAGTIVVRTTKGKSRRIAGNKKLALGTFTLAANTTKTVKLKLRKPARKMLKQTRRAGVRSKLTLTNERVTTFTDLKLTR